MPVVLPGGSIPLPEKFQIGLAWDFKKHQAPVELEGSVVGMDRQMDPVMWCGAQQQTTTAMLTHKTSGDGDNETFSFDLDPANCGSDNVQSFAVLINSIKMQPIASVKFTYLRLIVDGKTYAFYGLNRDHIPDQQTTGLLMGVVERSPDGWLFRNELLAAPGQTAASSFKLIRTNLRARVPPSPAAAETSDINLVAEGSSGIVPVG